MMFLLGMAIGCVVVAVALWIGNAGGEIIYNSFFKDKNKPQ
jgi:hypothetical protein